MTLWRILDKMPGLAAVEAEWVTGIGEQFQALRSYFEALPHPALSYPCPHDCGCDHDVIPFGDTFRGFCSCHPPECYELVLTQAEVTLWRLNVPKLARALCQAFEFQRKIGELGLYSTIQIGYWASEVPVILTIQWQAHEFRYIIAELALRFQRPFILLGPTSAHLDARCQEILARAKSEYFPLERHVILTDHGIFQPTKAPGEIFAKFTPEPVDEYEMLRKAIVLVKATDAAQGRRKVTLYTVMRLYCFDCLTAEQITRRCGCARSITFARLAELRQKLGRDPAELRRCSAHFENIEKSLADPRAKCVYRKGAINGEDD